MRILVVEDEIDLNNLIYRWLKKKGYALDSAFDGEQALNLYHENDYDLILLDLNLPKISGLDVLRMVRKENMRIKILILSAQTAIDERVRGLDMGANDYLIKPFDLRELEARIRTLLRMDFKLSPNILMVKELYMDTNQKKVFINKEELSLTRKEYAILEYLMLHKGELISGEELFEHVWNNEADEFSNVLKFHMHSLKKKIAQVSDEEYIENKRGLGYRVVVDEKN